MRAGRFAQPRETWSALRRGSQTSASRCFLGDQAAVLPPGLAECMSACYMLVPLTQGCCIESAG